MTTRTRLIDKESRLVGYRIKTDKNGTFDIPVFDSRIPGHAEKISKMEKATDKGSKFFAPSYSVLKYRY